MPAVYAHLRFGERVTYELPFLFKLLIEKYPEAFDLGTQGPDILYYYKPFKKTEIRENGSILHNTSGNDFFSKQAEKLLKYGKNLPEILEKDGGAYASYVCGFICHFVLDVLCHPYVDEKTSEEVSHFKIESEFDKFLLREDELPIRGFNTATLILDKNGTRESVATALDIAEVEVQNAIKTMRTVNKLFSFPFEPFHFLAQFILHLANMSDTFGDMFLFKKDDPLCVESNQVLNERLLSAVPKASELIVEVFENLEKFKEAGKLDNDLLRHDFGGNIKEE